MSDNSGNTFGELLNEMIKLSPYSKREFYEKLGIKKAYFYDILHSRIAPPPSQKQFAIISILQPDDDMCHRFFELAAKERDEFPADMRAYLDEKQIDRIRRSDGFCDFIKLIKKEGFNHD